MPTLQPEKGRKNQGCVNVGVNGVALGGRGQLPEKSDLLAIQDEGEVEGDPHRLPRGAKERGR